MNRTLIGLYALLWLFAAGRGWSQSAGEEAPEAPRRVAEPAATAAAAGIYEEVEVLRRLLNRGLESAYGLPPAHGVVQRTRQGVFYAPVANYHPAEYHVGGAEGVYVKGCGVVYSATLPPPARPPVPQAMPAVPTPPSAWEQARAELRGEKPRRPEETADRQTSLGEAVLRLLAENGRHFRHLPEGEQITVALTFRRATDCAQCHAGIREGTVSQPAPRDAVHASLVAAGYATPAGNQPAWDPNTLSQGVSVGDLHLRQRRYDEAEKAYTGALHDISQALNREKERQGAMELKTLLASVEVANKLAQLYTAKGDNTRGLKFLEVARRSAQWAEERAGQGKAGPAAGVPLPSRLVVSAPKKILDQVGAGKMSFEEFRKAAAVEYLTFPPPDKAGPKPAAGKP
jgi:hypothetical protein